MSDTRTDTERLEALVKRAERLHTRMNRLQADLFDLSAEIMSYKPSAKMPGEPS